MLEIVTMSAMIGFGGVVAFDYLRARLWGIK